MASIAKACAIAVSSATLLAMSMPSFAQSIRAQRATPSQSGPGEFQQQEIPNQERMACTRGINVFFTQRGIAFTCRQEGKNTKIMAIDHDKFPGGIDSAMTMLMTAKATYKSVGGQTLGVRYRSATPKTKMICNLTGIVSTVECAEVVAMDL